MSAGRPLKKQSHATLLQLQPLQTRPARVRRGGQAVRSSTRASAVASLYRHQERAQTTVQSPLPLARGRTNLLHARRPPALLLRAAAVCSAGEVPEAPSAHTRCPRPRTLCLRTSYTRSTPPLDAPTHANPGHAHADRVL